MEVSKPPPVGIRGEEDIPPQAFGPASGRSAVLGRMPWDSRATALGPDIKEIGATRGRFNGGFKKSGRAGRRSVGDDGALGLYGKDYVDDHVNTGGAPWRKGSNDPTAKPKSRSRRKRKRRALRRLRRRSGPSAAGQRVRRGNAAPLRCAAVALTRRGRSGVGQVSVRKRTVPLASSAGIAMLPPGISS